MQPVEQPAHEIAAYYDRVVKPGIRHPDDRWATSLPLDMKIYRLIDCAISSATGRPLENPRQGVSAQTNKYLKSLLGLNIYVRATDVPRVSGVPYMFLMSQSHMSYMDTNNRLRAWCRQEAKLSLDGIVAKQSGDWRQLSKIHTSLSILAEDIHNGYELLETLTNLPSYEIAPLCLL